MSEQLNNKKPEIFALHQDGKGWQISRRDFLKAAGIGAAAVGIGLNSRLVKPVSAEESLEALCKSAPTHTSEISRLVLSQDGLYLVSQDKDKNIKCWTMDSFELMASKKDFSLMSKDKIGLGEESVLAAGIVNGKQCLLFNPDNKTICYRELPKLDKSSEKSIPLTVGESKEIYAIAVDSKGNIFVSRTGDKDNVIRLEPGDGSEPYTKQTVILSSNSDRTIIPGKIFGFLDNDEKMLVSLSYPDLALMNTATGEFEKIKGIQTKNAAIVPGDANALSLCYAGDYLYEQVSLDSSEKIWHHKAETLRGSTTLKAVSISPDGKTGLLLGDAGTRIVYLISMADGSLLNMLDTEVSGVAEQIFISNDGSKFVIAVENSLIFMSLPDMKIIGCPIDLSDVKDSVKGIEITGTDPVTGGSVTYTLPCGAPIPAGAVCTCNCVAGKIPDCSCVGNTCSCVGNICSCVGHTVTYHYWHPN